MKRFFRHILLTLFATLSVAIAWADGAVTFEVNTPLIVSTGEMFRVEFIITNGKPDSDTFVAPDFAGLDVLAGPTTSQARSYQNINGVASHTSTFTITYVVTAQNAGNLTIGSASVEVDGKSYKTKATPIEVVEQSRKQEQEAAAQQGSAVNNQIAQDDILLRLNLSRSAVYKGEPIRASLTLYTRAGIAGFEDVKLPSFNGFWSQELPTDNYQAKRETLDGKVYDSQIIKEWLLYPQQSGTLSIEPADITAVAQVVMRTNRNFDPFFGGGAEVYNVKRKLTTGQVNVAVKDLPAGAPASFNGAVGKFTMSTTQPSTQLKANSAATYTVKISGTGNLTFLQTPKLTLPSSFELYNVRQTESIQTSVNGTSGYKQFEYPFIARAEGEYDIEPIEFTFFSPEKEGYVTLSTDALKVNVAPDGSAGAVTPQQIITGTSKEGVRQLGSDIRFIKLGKAQLSSSVAPLMMSSTYFMLLALIVVLFVGLYLLLGKMIKDSKNTVLLRNRRANKVAVQRFRQAEKYMREMNRHAFYEEMLRALWGYMSDKLNIPVSNLTKEGIREELQRRGCPQQDAQHFTEIITRCDEAQYSPAEWVQMNDVYAEGVRIISRIEQAIKR
ncbi:MAG: protein BatD [Alistipes sp.]|nr:protein BatD [Alistipes sp.]